MSSKVNISSISVERSIVNKNRASETATVTFQIDNLIYSGKVFPVRLDVGAQGKSNRQVIDAARENLHQRLQSAVELLQDLDSFLPPDW